MCGRYALENPIKNTSDIVKSVIGEIENLDNYNISPGQRVPVVKKYSNGRALENMTWSILPSWAKDKDGFRPLHNTRIESLNKPYFKKLLSINRVLVPCTNFYEWQKFGENKKKPFCFKSKNEAVMLFAGIFDGNQFSIITKESSEQLKKIHHRQPMIINKSKINDYLNIKNNGLDVLESIKDPGLEYFEISDKINNPKNNSKDLIIPLQK